MSQAAEASSRQSSSARSVARAGESALLPGRGSAAAVEEGGGEGAGLRTRVRTCQHHPGSHLDVSGKTMMSPSSPVVPVLAGGLAVSMLTLTISVSRYLYLYISASVTDSPTKCRQLAWAGLK